jgi:phosphoadenylyl-sulfate reductase (thioredoxin)
MNAAATLSVAHSAAPEAPVIWIDTGYLPKETQEFASELTQELGLDVHKYTPKMSTSDMETRFGKLWEMDSPQASQLYDMLRKVEPMVRSIRDMNVSAVIAGVQRENIPIGRVVEVVTVQNSVLKICPFLKWEQNDADIYLQQNNLTHHPLTGQYTSIGDLHSMMPKAPAIPIDQKKTCADQRHETRTDHDHGISFMPLYLIAVLGGLVMLWSKYGPDYPAADSPISQIPTPKLERSGEEETAEAPHEGSYFTVSGATGEMLRKELQAELQGGVNALRIDTMRENCGISFAQPDFWEKSEPSTPPSKKTAMADLHSLSPHGRVSSGTDVKLNSYLNSFTVSGAGGSALAAELQRTLHRRRCGK